jgi:hypothetical protein
MGFLDKAKAAAEQAANRANETVADVQTKRELAKAYGDFGEKAYELADSGAISHPDLQADVARIRELKAKLDEEDGAGDAGGSSDAAGAGTAAAPAPAASAEAGTGDPAGGSEAAGAGTAAAAADASAPAGGTGSV